MAEQFQTQRERLLKLYADAKIPFVATSKPYKSTLYLPFEIADTVTGAASTVSHIVFRKGTTLQFFGYGLNDPIPDGVGGTTPATDAETNQQKGTRTNGAEDFVIEGVSFTAASKRVETVVPNGVTLTDSDVEGFYAGTVDGLDPAAIARPPQVDSPFNLEEALLMAVAPFMSITFQWDQQRIDKVGTMDQIGEGGAKSFLRANGEPLNANRYKIPEGYLWRRDGEPDSQFVSIVKLERSVVVPISAIAIFGATAVDTVPEAGAIRLTMRVHGLRVTVPSQN